MDDRIVVTPEEARAARKTGVVRYVLAVSLLLAIIGVAIAYVFTV
jgi:hypothetical protein